MSDALDRYYSYDDDPISAATNLFADVINIHPFEDSLFCLTYSCRMDVAYFLCFRAHFDRRGRWHYLQSVRRYYENPLMLYTMVAASLVYVWDNLSKMLPFCENRGCLHDETFRHF